MSGRSNSPRAAADLRGKAIQKNREASERSPAKAVNRLPVVADHHQVGALAAQLPEQFELRDVRVLKFIDEDVAISRAEFFAQRVILAEPHDGVHDLRAKREQLALAQQEIAGAIGPRNFLKLGDFLVADATLVLGHRGAHAAEIFRLLVGITLVLIRRRPVRPGSGRKIPRNRARNCPGSASRRNWSSCSSGRLRRSRIQWSIVSMGFRSGLTS